MSQNTKLTFEEYLDIKKKVKEDIKKLDLDNKSLKERAEIALDAAKKLVGVSNEYSHIYRINLVFPDDNKFIKEFGECEDKIFSSLSDPSYMVVFKRVEIKKYKDYIKEINNMEENKEFDVIDLDHVLINENGEVEIPIEVETVGEIETKEEDVDIIEGASLPIEIVETKSKEFTTQDDMVDDTNIENEGKEVEAKTEELLNRFGSMIGDANSLKNENGRLNKENEALRLKIEELNNEIVTLRGKNDFLSKENNELNKSSKELSEAIKNSNKRSEELKQEAEKYKYGYKRYKDGFNTLTNALTDALSKQEEHKKTM